MHAGAAYDRLETVVVGPDTSIADSVRLLDRAGTGALVVCDADRALRGLLTDGDIRRAFLRKVSFDSPCLEISSTEPIVAGPELSRGEMMALMQRFDVNHLPLTDAAGYVLGLVLRSDLTVTDRLDASAVIMAGGFGKRLFPLTESVPKPLLPVGDKPLMEITLEQLRRSGIRRVHVTTHYLAEQISDHFGDGSAFGVDLKYVTETQPLGTVGGLKLMDDFREPLLVINGDILTGVDFQQMLAYHREHRGDMTVGVRRHDVEVRYGVLDCDGPHVRRLREKPKWEMLVNAGIYILEPSVARFIPSGKRFDMTDLLQRLLDAGRSVVGFPILEQWLDVGTHADYARAQEFASASAAVAASAASA